ncbi:MAG: phosphoribosylanthranilate isomerase [Acidimicrobiales bacterium]
MGRNDDDLVVKICGVTTEADALLAVGLGADAIGFIFAPSPRQMAPAAVADIVKRLPRDVLTVGVFRDEAPSRVVEIANRLGLGAVQLHGHETPEQSTWVRARVACVIKAFPAGDRHIADFAEYGADYLLIDGQNPGSGSVFDWRLAEGVVDPSSMFVSGGLHAGNVGEAIARLRPRGVDVSSGVEAWPGHKEPQKLRAFIRQARDAHDALVRDSEEARAQIAGEGGGGDAGATGESPGRNGTYGRGGANVPYDWMEG